MGEWGDTFTEMFGDQIETVCDPIRVDEWRTMHNKDQQIIMLAFRSGKMATGLLFPAHQTAEIGEALIQSAKNAARQMADDEPE